MQTLSIVPDLDKLERRPASFCVRCEPAGGALSRERTKEALGHGVVVAVASATHAGRDDFELIQPARRS
jgi:hypothetical protein